MKDFGGDNTTISLGTYSFSDGFQDYTILSPLINTQIADKNISVPIPKSGVECNETIEDGAVAYLYSKPNALQLLVKTIKHQDISRVKELVVKKFVGCNLLHQLVLKYVV